MEAGRKSARSARRWAALFLLIAASGCSLTGSRASWYSPVDSPSIHAGNDSDLASAHAAFLAGRAAEAAGNPACIDHYYTAATATWPRHAACAVTNPDEGSELYRASVQRLIGSAVHFGRLNQTQGITLCSGQVVPITYHGFLWQPCEFASFIPVGSYSWERLSGRYAMPGIGVEYVVLASTVPQRPFLNSSQPFAATAVLKPVDGAYGGFALEFYDPLRMSATASGMPIARDITAPVAYAGAEDGDGWLEGFLRPDSDPAAEGLRMTQPFQPGKIPIVFVHGLASSPLTWSNLENDLRAQPEIMARYQVWVFRYDTGDPFLSSAALLRRQLAELRQTYDPCRADPNLSQTVVIGHSLGGLIAKLQVTYSGEEIWNSAAKQPLNTIVTDAMTRDNLGRAFYFAPSPDISRVVYIATPHRGSIYATRCIGRASSGLVRDRPEWIARHEQLVRDNPSAFRAELERGIPTSVDLLEPSSCILQATNRIPYRQGVRLHSIIGDDRWTLSEGRTDGVVAVSSAQLLGVQSEIFVDASHTEIQRRRETTCEVLRILQVHLAQSQMVAYPMMCARTTAFRYSGSGALDQSQREDQQYGADGGRDQRAEQSAGRDPQLAE